MLKWTPRLRTSLCCCQACFFCCKFALAQVSCQGVDKPMGVKRDAATLQSPCGRLGTMNINETLNINSGSRSREAEGSKEQQPASATSWQ
mmetsp:Transcript_116801/g.232814  ORF Transcript_116801/g.232814 Transcript_116801/m.232814 type:complete len:90 (-) Transcript_116801:374-643(-)